MQLTRRELYEKVWTVPCQRLAQEFGISNVALAKVCRKHNIPRPPRGYWARLAVGQKPHKADFIPDKHDETVRIVFNVEQNLQRRKEWGMTNAKGNVTGAEQARIELPAEGAPLHAVAERLSKALANGKPSKNGRIEVQTTTVPYVLISPALASKAVRVVHAICTEIERRGLAFESGDAARKTLWIKKGKDRVTFRVEEGYRVVEREPTPEEKKKPSWEWQLKSEEPSGELKLSLESDAYLTGRRQWTESSKGVEAIIPKLVDRLEGCFTHFEQERIRTAEREREWAEAQRRRDEQQRKDAHESALLNVRSERAGNLIKAAEWWRISQTVLAFIDACEKQWKEPTGALTEAQISWLAWAKKRAADMSPLAFNFPDPLKDGPFDAAGVPFGGPYPKTRDIPKPPTMKGESQQSSNYGYYQPPQEYPFWLKYQR